MKKFISLLISLVLIIGNNTCAFFRGSFITPEAVSLDELEAAEIDKYFDVKKTAETVYVLNLNALSEAEKSVAISLQGITSQTECSIYFALDNYDKNYYSKEKDINFSYYNPEGQRWTLWELVEMFSNRLNDNGCVLFSFDDHADSLNMASVAAGVEGWLTVHESLRDTAEAHGLKVKEDYSGRSGKKFIKEVYKKYRSEVSKTAIISLSRRTLALRDLGIQQKMFMLYVNENKEGQRLRKQILKNLNPGAIVLGWGEDEPPFIKSCSQCGCAAIPSDFSYNLSFHIHQAESVSMAKPSDSLTPDESKHYAALVVSDGDNIQWTMGGYPYYYNAIKSAGNYPITWTMSPLLPEFCTPAAKKITNSATDNFSFIAACSGAGYFNPSAVSIKDLDVLTSQTALRMYKTGLRAVTVLDDLPGKFEDTDFENRLGMYTRFDNIDGGILQLGNRYAGANGKVWFVGDKPFISARFSLWTEEGDSETWLEDLASELNSMPADPYSVKGYSIINVHPWSVGIDDINRFVEMLDDDVELITAEQLISMVTENVPHKTAE